MTNYPLFNFFILFSEELSSMWEPQGCPCEKELCVLWEDFWRVRSSLSVYVCVKKLKGVRNLIHVFCLGQAGSVCRLAHRCSLHDILSSSCMSLEHWEAGTRWRVQLSLLTGNLPVDWRAVPTWFSGSFKWSSSILARKTWKGFSV